MTPFEFKELAEVIVGCIFILLLAAWLIKHDDEPYHL